jgi:predicted phage tail protein
MKSAVWILGLGGPGVTLLGALMMFMAMFNDGGGSILGLRAASFTRVSLVLLLCGLAMVLAWLGIILARRF